MTRQAIQTSDAPAAIGPYSQAIRAGDLLFCLGQGPYGPDGTRLGETIAEQVRQVLSNLDAVARAGFEVAFAVTQDRGRYGEHRVGIYRGEGRAVVLLKLGLDRRARAVAPALARLRRAVR